MCRCMAVVWDPHTSHTIGVYPLNGVMGTRTKCPHGHRHLVNPDRVRVIVRVRVRARNRIRARGTGSELSLEKSMEKSEHRELLHARI